MANDRIERVDEINDSEAPKDISERIETPDRVAPNKDHFDSLIGQEKQPNTTAVPVEPLNKNNQSVFDQVKELQQKVEGVSRASPDTIVAEATKVIKRIEEVKSQLKTPGLELKSSQQNLLQNKLNHIDESLKISLNRAGLEYTPEAPTPKENLARPIEKFIGLLTHGQYQLQHMAQNIEMMSRTKQEIKPADMLAIQIKMGFVQQEIELFTNLLNKALESTKTIMNVQI